MPKDCMKRLSNGICLNSGTPCQADFAGSVDCSVAVLYDYPSSGKPEADNIKLSLYGRRW